MNTLKIVVLFYFLASAYIVVGQLNIYTDQGNLVTGTWQSNGVLMATGNGSPYEGNSHYQFDYSYNQYWGGFGLNLDNWGNGNSYDFSGFTHIEIAYRGMSPIDELSLSLKSDATTQSNALSVGPSTSSYSVVSLPLQFFSGVNMTSITELVLGVSSSSVMNSGTLYVDNIRLTNNSNNDPPYDGSNANHTSVDTWLRYAQMDKGFNFANWLEAYWLIPFNAYPEATKYNRSVVSDLVGAGFNSFRLPVTFERIADQSVPYSIPTASVIWDLIDSAMIWAEELDFNLIICNHHGFNIDNSTFRVELPRKQAIWTQFLDKYPTLDTNRFFLELFNEPHSIHNDSLHIFYESLIDTVRALGSKHTLIVGGNGYNSRNGLYTSYKYDDANIIYTIHDYNPYFFTHQGLSWTSPPNFPPKVFPEIPQDTILMRSELEKTRIWADTSGVPMMMGEIGVSSSADAVSRCNWVNTICDIMYANHMPYYYWDAISLSDAFGFFDTTTMTMIPCFEQSMRLGIADTCQLVVTNAEDIGSGSLRSALNCAQDGDTIRFDASLAGDTIVIRKSPLTLLKNVVVKNDLASLVYLEPSYDTEVIAIAEGVHPIFVSVGFISSPSGRWIHHRGATTFINCTFDSDGGDILHDKGHMIIEGVGTLK